MRLAGLGILISTFLLPALSQTTKQSIELVHSFSPQSTYQTSSLTPDNFLSLAMYSAATPSFNPESRSSLLAASGPS